MNIDEHATGSPCLCSHLRKAAQRVTDFYDRMLRPTGISTSQYALLANLSCMEGCGTGELARAVRHEKSTLVRTLQPLLQAGYIEDRSAGTNRRRQLWLTPEGRRVLQQAIPLWKDAQRAVRASLGGSDEQLKAVLRVLDGL